MSDWRCPEALTHGTADASGRCPFCRQKIDAKRRRPGPDFAERKRRAREQDPLSIEPDESTYYEE